MNYYLKIQKAFNRVRNILYHIDIAECDGDILTIKGWIYSNENRIKEMEVAIQSAEKNYIVRLKSGLERVDVAQKLGDTNAKKTGFFGRFMVSNVGVFSASIIYYANDRKYKLYLGKFRAPKIDSNITVHELNENEIDIYSLLGNQLKENYKFPEEYRNNPISIIIPIYNGYEYLDALLKSVARTRLKYSLYLINDKSPDSRVLKYLEKYSEDKENVFLINNENNLGFVQTVNKGLSISKGTVAIVNSDVELPDLWLERLLLPIFENSQIASSTPYTNCGTLCSFPEFCKDNPLFINLTVDQIDSEFIKIKPRYEKIPTGVGFCMGMSREAIEKIGMFDADVFGKGYGEENDWCQRAINAGYKNVHVENLFVYHKHGGSFLSEEKKRLLNEHEAALLKKHPQYNRDVAKYCNIDPNKDIREFVKLMLILEYKEFESILVFDHNLGGGASAYLKQKEEKILEEGKAFIIVQYDHNKTGYIVCFQYQNETIAIRIERTKVLFDILRLFKVRFIWINELVSYPEVYNFLDEISKFSEKYSITIKMFIHDFYCVCPTINLIDCSGKYCFVQKGKICNECLKKVVSLQYLEYGSMEKWRCQWGAFLKKCNEIVVFSENSKNIIESCYKDLKTLNVIPHTIDYLPKIKKYYKTTDTLNIGLLGFLAKHKGRDIIEEVTRIIEKEKLNIRIILIGSTTEKINSKVFKETGEYTRDMLPRLILENDIDFFFISSICPETFSYTTEEVMQMDMPLISFDIGAPADRIKAYYKGTIIPDISAKAVVNFLKSNPFIEQIDIKKCLEIKILFVVEDITFSSRYRVDHLREQLLFQGIDSDWVKIEECLKCDLRKYKSIVIYRSSKKDIVNNLLHKAHLNDIKVFYDIDDYIFNYEHIQDLDFLNRDDYAGFGQYSKQIRQCMQYCDGYIVSTDNLKKAIESLDSNKPVLVNRNVASMEMLIISLGIQKKYNLEKVILGYFSGSKTHDGDFSSIEEELIDILDRNQNVHLLVGGQINLPVSFDKYKERIEKFDFVPWKKLPQLISKADINLMPLEDTFFHACKSENKWMEAALVGVPTVASWNSELEKAIIDGENGYLCKTSEDWKYKIQRLVESDDLRKKMAEDAKKHVIQKYLSTQVSRDVIELLSGRG